MPFIPDSPKRSGFVPDSDDKVPSVSASGPRYPQYGPETKEDVLKQATHAMENRGDTELLNLLPLGGAVQFPKVLKPAEKALNWAGKNAGTRIGTSGAIGAGVGAASNDQDRLEGATEGGLMGLLAGTGIEGGKALWSGGKAVARAVSKQTPDALRNLLQGKSVSVDPGKLRPYEKEIPEIAETLNTAKSEMYGKGLSPTQGGPAGEVIPEPQAPLVPKPVYRRVATGAPTATPPELPNTRYTVEQPGGPLGAKSRGPVPERSQYVPATRDTELMPYNAERESAGLPARETWHEQPYKDEVAVQWVPDPAHPQPRPRDPAALGETRPMSYPGQPARPAPSQSDLDYEKYVAGGVDPARIQVPATQADALKRRVAEARDYRDSAKGISAARKDEYAVPEQHLTEQLHGISPQVSREYKELSSALGAQNRLKHIWKDPSHSALTQFPAAISTLGVEGAKGAFRSLKNPLEADKATQALIRLLRGEAKLSE